MQKITPWIPNGITIFRVGIAVAIGVVMFLPNSLQIVQVLAVAGIISDKLDGSLARMWKCETELGKKLESVADPFFNFVLGIYLLWRMNFPWSFFWVGLGLFLITITGRAVAQIMTKKFFYEKSPLTRYGTLSLYIVILMYLFAIPYRGSVIVVVWIYGFIVAANYIRMVVRRIQKEQREKSAVLK